MMTVRFTVIDDASRTADVIADIEPMATVGDLRSALEVLGFRMPTLVVNGRSGSDPMPLASLEVTHGSIVSARVRSEVMLPTDGLHLVVVSGPEAGAWVAMQPSRPIRVGRSEGELQLRGDGLLSRVHAEFSQTDGHVVVRDLQSSNGTLVEGEAITEPVAIVPGSFVHIGSSVLTVIGLEQPDRAILTSPDGAAYPLPRTFREARTELAKEVRRPRQPSDASSASGSTWWRSLLPLVTGIGFAVATGRLLFLLLSCLAPIIFAADAYRQKRRRSNQHQQSQTEWQAADAAARASFDATWREERRRRRVTSPVGGVAAVFAASRHRRLWERRPADADFGHVTVGLATVPSGVAFIEPGGDEQRKINQPMWGTPVDVDLIRTGSLAVLGDIGRGRAVVRSILLTLGVTHSPNDVRIWMFSDTEHAHEWAAVRWLPHAMTDDETFQFATLPDARSTMLSRLQRIVEQRLEVRRPGNAPTDLPVHIAVFDGAELARGRDFNAILDRGASVGVIGIVVDSKIAPEGIMGELRLGREADQAVFESRSQTRLESVLTAEVPVVWAEPAMRRLAALRPAATDAAALPTSSPRLADMVGADGTDAAALAERWQHRRVVTRVPVGVVSGVGLEVDLVRDGPHGLIGGMTRSGKTEFLKTFITSLAWANHPDDLCFVIVDFKGGIDYTAMVSLPHVLDVSSNQDLDGFERTIELMTAELRRRQQLFEPLQVANLDAYHVARERKSSLPAVPRMIVLVDEFGEMLESDTGRQQLGKLESMARIGGGLGVHLLLVTQNFQGQLPDQIAANAGFRVCFRVEDSSHSKIVLSSGVASTIPASAKGRGYARFQGSEPFEFQSARVAGRRPDLQGRVTPVVAQLQTIDSLSTTARHAHAADVPAEETDMVRMFDTIAKASERLGWTTSAVPWPARLPDDLPLASVVGAHAAGVHPIGLADVPDKQAQTPFSLRQTDEHVALLGGARADLNGALITIASSIALTSSPSDVHLYGIDFTGRGLARIGRLPHCGGVASQSESLAVRIARFLAEEAAHRRAELGSVGVSSLEEYVERTHRTFPHLMLLIAGAERLSSAGNYDEPSAAAPFVANLIQQGAGLGIQVIAAGLPSFANYRPGAQIDRRIVFASPSVNEYTNLGCPRELLSDLSVPRRGVDISGRVVVQLASLAAGRASEADVLDALTQRLTARWQSEEVARPARRLVEVAWPIKLPVLLSAADRPPPRSQWAFPLGVDNVTGDVTWAVPREVGKVMFVTGGKRSGRSTALMSIALSATEHGWSVVAASGSDLSPLHDPESPVQAVDLGAVDAALEQAPHPRMVVIDDIHRLDLSNPGIPKHLASADLVVLVGSNSVFSGTQKVVTALQLERTRNGVVLKPAGFGDIDAFQVSASSVRPETYRGKRVGQGLFGVDGELVDVTIPLVGDIT